ncbi:MAG TPA: glycine-rich protein [Clostridia bacterium]|nr:glycine-rich protein [Clostridia bacterium]
MAVFSFVSLGGKAEAAITQVGQSETFNFTGGMQTFTVSVTGYYNIELYGASGGNSNTAAGYGRGGKVAGTIYLKAGDVLYIFVGGAGKEGVGSDSGGYNGGGNATGTFAGGGGGGATDIRVGGTSLVDRIMVAGGGGGHNDVNSTVIYGGGNGGGLTGGNGNCYDHGTVNISNTGKGASQTAGGALGTNSNASGSTSGSFGQGGNGGFNNDGHSGGGGGGGYYGGGGSAWHAGAGGGSSFISGYEGCDAVTRSGRHTGSSVHFSGYVFTNGSMVTGGAPAGNGKAVITLTSTQPQAGFTQQIDYTGGLYAYKIPLAGYYRVTLYGAAAGYVATGWGSGGSVTGVTFFPAETLVYVYVGGAGGANAGGYNGGGTGGGGGYYGGGGSVWHAGAGGGSSFISGYPGCDAVNQYGAHTGTSTHFSGYTFFDANMTTGGRAGNGCAVLTAIQLDETPPSAHTLTPDRSASSGYYYDSVRVDFSGGADSGVGFSRFEYRIGDGSWTAGNSVVLSSALTSGTESKTLTVRAYDKVNNYSETQATYQFDRTVYTITYHNVTAGFTNPNPSGYNVETPVITLQNINRDGFTFGGFYNDAGFISPASTSIPKGSRGNKAYYVKLTLNAPTASLPSSATSTYGDTKTLTVVPYHTNSSVTYSYQWQIQPSGASSFSDIPSANAISYAYKTSATGIFSFRVTMRAHLDGFVSDPIMSGTLNLNVIRRDIYVYASAVVRTYGDQFVTPLPYTTSNDLVGEDTLYGALACPDLKQEAGLYPITAGTIINENNPNYNIIFQLNYYTVQRKDITVEVNGISTVYGDPLITRYTYTATGFVNGDTALEGELSCPSLQQKAGVYPITAGTVTNENNKNYNIIYIGADYVISRKSIYITAMPLYRVYGEALLTVFPYIRSDDLINGDILSGALFCPSLEQSAGS